MSISKMPKPQNFGEQMTQVAGNLNFAKLHIQKKEYKEAVERLEEAEKPFAGDGFARFRSEAMDLSEFNHKLHAVLGPASLAKLFVQQGNDNKAVERIDQATRGADEMIKWFSSSF